MLVIVPEVAHFCEPVLSEELLTGCRVIEVALYDIILTSSSSLSWSPSCMSSSWRRSRRAPPARAGARWPGPSRRPRYPGSGRPGTQMSHQKSRTHSRSVKRARRNLSWYVIFKKNYLSASVELEDNFESWKKSLKFDNRPKTRHILKCRILLAPFHWPLWHHSSWRHDAVHTGQVKLWIILLFLREIHTKNM